MQMKLTERPEAFKEPSNSIELKKPFIINKLSCSVLLSAPIVRESQLETTKLVLDNENYTKDLEIEMLPLLKLKGEDRYLKVLAKLKNKVSKFFPPS